MNIKTGTLHGYVLLGIAFIVYLFSITGSFFSTDSIPLLYCSAAICFSIGGMS